MSSASLRASETISVYVPPIPADCSPPLMYLNSCLTSVVLDCGFELDFCSILPSCQKPDVPSAVRSCPVPSCCRVTQCLAYLPRAGLLSRCCACRFPCPDSCDSSGLAGVFEKAVDHAKGSLATVQQGVGPQAPLPKKGTAHAVSRIHFVYLKRAGSGVLGVA